MVPLLITRLYGSLQPSTVTAGEVVGYFGGFPICLFYGKLEHVQLRPSNIKDFVEQLTKNFENLTWKSSILLLCF